MLKAVKIDYAKVALALKCFINKIPLSTVNLETNLHSEVCMFLQTLLKNDNVNLMKSWIKAGMHK